MRARLRQRALGLESLEGRALLALMPQLVLDVNTNTLGSNPWNAMDIGSTTYFGADDGVHGQELWKSDGTAAGTVLVKDINPGSAGADLGNFANVNGTLFFSSYSTTNHMELWKSNGTTAGTVLVKSLNDFIFEPMFTSVNGTLFFTGRLGELWKSDGTATGTKLVKNFNTTNSFQQFTDVNGTLFFSAYDGTTGYELWKSDGTATGTVRVKDLNPGIANSYPRNLTNVNGTLFFTGADGSGGDGLFKSNGTATGTVLVKHFSFAGSWWYSGEAWITNVNGMVFFTADDGTTGFELWKSDGTTAGTALVSDIFPGTTCSYEFGCNLSSSLPQNLTAVNGNLFFTANDSINTRELWMSDGNGAIRVISQNASNLASVNGKLLFNSTGGMWKTDGTQAGTVLVSPLPTGSLMTIVNGILFYSADDGTHGAELWKSDGTPAGTILVKDINVAGTGSSPRNLTNVNGINFFTANDGTHGPELWKSDGTPAGTVFVKDINLGAVSSETSNLTNVNGKLFFSAFDGSQYDGVMHGVELWKSDGTAAGTVLVKDINTNDQAWENSYPTNLTNVNGTLFFSATDGLNGVELWKSDGTETGTVLVKDIFPGWSCYFSCYYPFSSSPSNLTNVNGTLFFTAGEDVNGVELWKSDGTPTGTVLVNDISGPGVNSFPNNLTNVNGTLYFTARHTLWKSDGTEAGTVFVKDIFPSDRYNPYPSHLTNVNGTLFFSATDGTNGNELWKCDGTATGTVRVKDINPGSAGSGPINLVNVNGTLYFSATDGTNGNELWKSDGTATGTVRVKDINPGSADSSPRNLTNVNGTLFFSADDATGAGKLWKSNGTAAGTALVANLTTSSLWNVNGTLFIAAADLVHGEELWKLVDDGIPDPLTLSIGDDVTVTEGQSGTTPATITVTLSIASTQTVTVNFVTADGTATAGSDYQAQSGTLTFAPGETSKTMTVLINGDRLPESNETFVVNLTGPMGATISDGQAVGTIADDEPRVSITDMAKAERKSGQSTLFTFTVTLSAAYDQPVTMSFKTVNGTATTSDSDYVAKTGTLTFNPGETTKTITIEVKGDRKKEADEDFYLDLFGLSSNALFTKNRGTGTILNDD